MAYLDPASNPGSKPQRFSVKNCKSSTPETIKTIFGISCKFADHNEKTLFVLFSNATAATLGGFSVKEITQPFRKIKTEINDLR